MELEITVSLQIIEHSRNKSLPVAPAAYLSGIGRYVADSHCSRCSWLGGLYHQYAEHFALFCLVQKSRIARILRLFDAADQIVYGHQAQRVGLIAERIGKCIGWKNVGVKPMKSHFIFFLSSIVMVFPSILIASFLASSDNTRSREYFCMPKLSAISCRDLSNLMMSEPCRPACSSSI